MPAELLLEARNLCYSHDHGVVALRNASLTVKPGVRLALLGNNGAGKTTLFLHMLGILRPEAGEILLDRRPVEYGRKFVGRWRQRVGMLLQDPEDQLFSANVEQDVSFGPLAAGMDEQQARERVRQTLQALGIEELRHRPVHLLSHGQKKRVALAGVLALSPELLILDEPTAGLDHPGQRQLLAALDRLHQAGAGILFSTHDIRLVRFWADEVAVMDRGTVIRQGDVDEVLTDPAVMQALGYDEHFMNARERG